jgi:hypothetical protein
MSHFRTVTLGRVSNMNSCNAFFVVKCVLVRLMWFYFSGSSFIKPFSKVMANTLIVLISVSPFNRF